MINFLFMGTVIGLAGRKKSGKSLVGLICTFLINADRMFRGDKKAYLEHIGGSAKYKDRPIGEWCYEELFDDEFFIRELNMGYLYEAKFAAKLKDIVTLLTNADRKKLDDDQTYKSSEIGPDWVVYIKQIHYHDTDYIDVGKPYSDPKEAFDSDLEPTKGLPIKQTIVIRKKYTYLDLMLMIGTDLFRNHISDSIWATALSQTLTPNKNWVVTDVRYPNEAKVIRGKGGFIIHLDRDDYIRCTKCSVKKISHENEDHEFTPPYYLSHDSEKPELLNAKYYIKNTSTIEYLIEEVFKILVKENVIQTPEYYNLFS